MLIRRHRETPEIDPSFALKPVDTMDPAFKHDRFVDSDVTNDSRLTAAETAAQLKGEALERALENANLSKDGKADEKRARLAEFYASQESIDPEHADVDRDPAEPESEDLI